MFGGYRLPKTVQVFWPTLYTHIVYELKVLVCDLICVCSRVCYSHLVSVVCSNDHYSYTNHSCPDAYKKV